MKHFLLIFLGGGSGSVLRYYMGRMLHRYLNTDFPLGTLGVNILSCFILGVVAGMIGSGFNLPPASRLLLITGFCGGLSTFSAFSYESVQLIQEEKYLYFVLYILLSLLLCFGVTFTGILLGSRF